MHRSAGGTARRPAETPEAASSIGTYPRWNHIRNESKYYRLLTFGRLLPRIRRRVTADLRRSGLPRDKILATVVRLLEVTLIRIGNEEYARTNESFGLTTLQGSSCKSQGLYPAI